MIEDTVALTKEISVELIPRVIDAAVDQFLIFATKYKDATTAYKNKHFENREMFKRFTATLVSFCPHCIWSRYLPRSYFSRLSFRPVNCRREPTP